QISLNIAPKTRFFGDEGDLLELLGNLIDNAFKYGKHQIQVSAYPAAKQEIHPGLILKIEDDGPGIDPELFEKLMQRGSRLDESIPGEGIGLAVAFDIISLYKGKLEATHSKLGGACLLVYWPPL
ncbi:hypothetical protein TI05_13145, partial [Achromatium sp. WMS3]